MPQSVAVASTKLGGGHSIDWLRAEPQSARAKDVYADYLTVDSFLLATG